MKVQLLIPAAGMGRRLEMERPKALVPIQGKPLLAHTLMRLREISRDAPVIVVVPKGRQAEFEAATGEVFPGVKFACGGEERQDSVMQGLNALDEDAEIVVIHDAARPFVPVPAILNAIEAARQTGAATLAVPVVDTILVSDGAGRLESTPDRSRLWACQTPQVFQADIIRATYEWARMHGVSCTDDATLATKAGYPVRLIEGCPGNFKVTTREDLARAEYLLERQHL